MANTKITSRVLADDAVLTANITDANVTTAKIAADAITTAKIADDVALGGNPTSTTQSAGNNTTRLATTAFVTTAVSNLADSAPAALDTLNELAAALGDDANFSTTVTNSIATKLPLAGGTMTGNTRLNDNVKHKYGSGDYFQVYHDGSNAHMANSSGDLTLDVAGVLNLDATTQIILKDDGTNYGTFYQTSSNFYIQSLVQDKDIVFYGNDSGSGVTALTLDMSEAGTATFNHDIKLGDNGRIELGAGADLVLTSDGTHGYCTVDNGNLSFDVAGEIRLSADDNGEIHLYDGGLHYGSLLEENSNLLIRSIVDNEDILFQGYDATVLTTALTLDMSKAGSATFNHDVILGDNGQAIFGAGDDLTIYHDGSDSYIKDTGSGNLLIQYSDLYFSKDAGSSHSVVFRSTGRVGIGTTGPSHMLHVSAADGESDNTQAMTIENNEATDGRSYGLKIKAGSTANDASLFVQDHDASNDHFIIRGNGNVGIGTTAPAETLHIKRADGTALIVESSNDQNNTGDRINIEFRTDAAQGIAKIIGGKEGNYQGSSTRSGYLAFQTINANSYAESMRITSAGNVGIGTTSPNAKLEISGKDDAGAGDLLRLIFDNSPADTGITMADINSTIKNRITMDASNTNDLRISAGTQIHFYGGTSDGTGAGHLTVNSSGNVSVSGSLSKGSGSFKIDHPLEAKKDTHHLVHSFVEAPQANNIYRGVVDLVGGSATINLDTVAGMTEGTYVLLNTNTSCFTSNETNWDAVKGSVSGNVLTINCQNASSTATVSWLVIGERHDQHMKDTNWTDDNGKVIVEPLKEEE